MKTFAHTTPYNKTSPNVNTANPLSERALTVKRYSTHTG
jgi:hypothetical protein